MAWSPRKRQNKGPDRFARARVSNHQATAMRQSEYITARKKRNSGEPGERQGRALSRTARSVESTMCTGWELRVSEGPEKRD